MRRYHQVVKAEKKKTEEKICSLFSVLFWLNFEFMSSFFQQKSKYIFLFILPLPQFVFS